MWNIKWNFLKNCPVNLPYWFWEAAPLCCAKMLKMISLWIHISCGAHRFKWGSSDIIDIMGQEIRPSLCFFWGGGFNKCLRSELKTEGTADYGWLWHYGHMFISTNLKFTYSPSSFLGTQMQIVTTVTCLFSWLPLQYLCVFRWWVFVASSCLMLF